jgi:hypothetical protein
MRVPTSLLFTHPHPPTHPSTHTVHARKAGVHSQVRQVELAAQLQCASEHTLGPGLQRRHARFRVGHIHIQDDRIGVHRGIIEMHVFGLFDEAIRHVEDVLRMGDRPCCSSRTFEGGVNYVRIRVHGGTSDENMFMTRTVCRTNVLFVVIGIRHLCHKIYGFEK